MSITANLERISTAKENIKNKLIEKGVDVPANARLDEFPDMFDQIQTGGGSDEWASIGYAAQPPYISDDIAYSKEIYDNWDASLTTLNNRLNNDTKMVYAPNVDLSNITSLEALHHSNSNLLYSPIVVKNNITTIRNIFYNCKSLLYVDASNWDISNVTDLYGGFYHCETIKELNVSNWNTGNVKDMSCLFDGCKKIQSLDVSNWDTSNVTNMSGLFNECASLTSLNLDNWDTSNVKSMSSLFRGCTSLTSLNISNWDTSNVTDISNMLCNVTFSTLDISKNNFDNVQALMYIFYNAKIKEVIGYLPIDIASHSLFNYSYIIGYSSNSYLRKITFKKFGKTTQSIISGTDNYQTFKNMTNWGVDGDGVTGAKQSVIDTLITYSVDRISEGYNPKVVGLITLSANTKALLTEDEIAQITAKGYTIA